MVSLPRHTATGTSQPRHKNDRHRTWMMEQALMHMVPEGNLDYKKVLEQSARISDGVPVKVRDSLQQAQVSGITLTTLCVRAAISGGLTPDAAYTVGDSYIQRLWTARHCRRLPRPTTQCMTTSYIVCIRYATTRPFRQGSSSAWIIWNCTQKKKSALPSWLG